jgi:hypothetical protein
MLSDRIAADRHRREDRRAALLFRKCTRVLAALINIGDDLPKLSADPLEGDLGLSA